MDMYYSSLFMIEDNEYLDKVSVDIPRRRFTLLSSEGDVRTEALKCRYEKTDGNVIQQVGGKVKTEIVGGSISCVSGGAFDGMASSPSSNSYDITVSGVMKTATSGNYVVEAGGNIDMDASAIYLN